MEAGRGETFGVCRVSLADRMASPFRRSGGGGRLERGRQFCVGMDAIIQLSGYLWSNCVLPEMTS